jgi:hypothetical protein
MRTTGPGGATASASFDMMLRMRVLLAGNPSGSSVHASHGGLAGAQPPLPGWSGRRGW